MVSRTQKPLFLEVTREFQKRFDSTRLCEYWVHSLELFVLDLIEFL